MDDSRHVVREVDVSARLVAGVKARVPKGGVAQAFAPYLDQVYAAGRDGAVQLDGQNVFIYRGDEQGVLSVEFCVGATAPFEKKGSVEPLYLPAGRAVMTTHHGDYSGLPSADIALRDWMSAHGRRCIGPSWEVYGHWDPDPSKLRTDVYYFVSR